MRSKLFSVATSRLLMTACLGSPALAQVAPFGNVDKISGTWDLESQENLDEYMKQIGADFKERKSLGAIKPTYIIGIGAEKITITINQSTGNSRFIIVNGAQNKADFLGRNKPDSAAVYEVVSVLGAEEGLINKEISDPNSSVSIIARGDKLVVAYTKNGVAATRIFKRTS
jgi:hypothetical protein